MRKLLFWSVLCLACVGAGLLVTPGLPEALGFAVPAVVASALAAWFARERSQRTRLILAATVAAGLMLGAITGVLGEARALDHHHGFTAPASSFA